MRLLGVTLAGMNLFSIIMELSTAAISKSYYTSIMEKIYNSAKAVSDVVFKKAIKEEKLKNVENEFIEERITVSGDGSWAKRGFTSLLGVTSLIGKYSNKIVDVEVKCKVCKACEKWKGKETTDEYLFWYDEHFNECKANHEGSSGKMEVDSIIEIFQRSVAQYGVKYVQYIGDGDSKTFTNLLDSDPYNGDPVINKKECVLHVKKRMYRRLKEAKKALTLLSKAKKRQAETMKKEILLLTNAIMLKLSAYYVLTIIINSESTEDMKTAIWATFYHYTSTDQNPQHSFCPQGLTSWCNYQQLKAKNEEKNYKHPPAFDKDTCNIIKPIYEELSSVDLLKRCIGRNTQNNNESFNNLVWQMAPKHIYVGKSTLDIAVYTAACTFNEGFMPVLKMLETMGVKIGSRCVAYAELYKNNRILQANRRSLDSSKAARSQRRSDQSDENEK